MPSVFACCRKRKHFFGRIKIHTFQTEDKSVIFPLSKSHSINELRPRKLQPWFKRKNVKN